MQNIANKQDRTSTLSAAEFNNLQAERENLVTSSGQSLDATGTDLSQMAKAAANYAAASDFYADTGAADAYVLAAIAPYQAATAYVDGMRVRFVPDNANTGASTVNVSALGAKDIKKTGGTVALAASDLPTARLVEITYLAGPDAFTLVSVS